MTAPTFAAVAADVRDADRMLALIAEWDTLTTEQKWEEWNADQRGYGLRGSRFREVPGFNPKWCEDCRHEVHPDYRHDPEGECPRNAGHALETHGTMEAAAA